MAGAVDNHKISDFVSHLYNSPNIKCEGLLVAEDMILGFLSKNLDKFKVMFQSPNFFPGQKTEKVLEMVVSELFQRSYQGVFPGLKKHIENLNFSFIKSLSRSPDMSSDFIKEKLVTFLDDIFKVKDVRYSLNAVFNILENQVIEKYLTQAFRRHGSVYHELIRMQRCNLGLEQYINYLKSLLILKSIAFNKVELANVFPGQKVNIRNFEKIPSNLKKYATALAVKGSEICPGFTPDIFEMSIKSNFKENYTEKQDASARLLFILSSRYHNYKPYEKIDKGAESPDKSWFAVVKKNAQYYGFNKSMLDGLYIIAGDNNW